MHTKAIHDKLSQVNTKIDTLCLKFAVLEQENGSSKNEIKCNTKMIQMLVNDRTFENEWNTIGKSEQKKY